jgi:sensor histidine kinase YesM
MMNHLLIRYVIDQQIGNSNQLIQEMRKDLDTKLQHYQQLTMQFYLNERAMEELVSDTPLLNCTAIQSQLDGFVNSNRLIASAYLITDRGSISSGTGIQGIEEINSNIQPTLEALEGRIHWTETFPMLTNFGLEDSFFFGARHIRKEQKPIATLLLGFNSLFFEDFFQYTPFGENQRIRLINSEGNLIASNHLDNDELLASVDEKRYITLSSSSTASDWEINLTLDTHEISGELTYIRDMFNLSTILYIIFFLIISLLVSRRLTKPIHALTWAVNKVGEGIMDIQVDVDHIDEIKQLSIGFNAMTDRIQKLLKEVKREEENKRKAHLQALQLQLTPHLLYNSLNTIRWMAQINGQENIKRITLALSRYLRSLSDIDSEYIPLRKELELVSDYADIQRFRYTEFTITTDVPPSLLDMSVHKLMIVNLVENSIIHGIANENDMGLITITAHTDEKTLFITVSDNGIGLPEEVLSTLEAETSPEGNHTGLKNIQDRLKLYHGPDCSMIIDSKHGCSITIALPLDQSDK